LRQTTAFCGNGQICRLIICKMDLQIEQTEVNCRMLEFLNFSGCLHSIFISLGNCNRFKRYSNSYFWVWLNSKVNLLIWYFLRVAKYTINKEILNEVKLFLLQNYIMK